MQLDRFQPLLFQPVPSLVSVSLTELMQEVRAAWFPEIDADLEVRIAEDDPLAFIWPGFMGQHGHLIVVHPVLNHPQTPVEVLRFIFKHELTHIVRPGRTSHGKYEAHPPEFWKHEFAIAPERDAAWRWINDNLRRCMRRLPSGQVNINVGWRALRRTSRTPYMPSLPFPGHRWDIVCPGDGAQLRLPPSWVVRPHPVAR